MHRSFMDDMTNFGDSFDSYLLNLKDILSRFKERELVLNMENVISWCLIGLF